MSTLGSDHAHLLIQLPAPHTLVLCHPKNPTLDTVEMPSVGRFPVEMNGMNGKQPTDLPFITLVTVAEESPIAQHSPESTSLASIDCTHLIRPHSACVQSCPESDVALNSLILTYALQAFFSLQGAFYGLFSNPG